MNKIPNQLVDSLNAVKGFDRDAFMQAHQKEAMTSVRLHPLKRSRAFADNERVPWCGEGRYLPQRPVFTLDPLYHAGAYYVQEASSMFLKYLMEQVLPERKNLRVLDLCAAPGGKSTLLASLLDKNSLLISNEVIRSRAGILEENMTRWGYMNTWVTCNDPRDFTSLKGYFDVVVVDAPCSGSGLFRKDEHALEEWSEANVQLCSQRQQRILADIWPAIKEGGVLIYATCSYSPQEDEDILDWLAEEFDMESIRINVPGEWGVVETLSDKNKMNGYRFFPDKVKGEGFFIAALRKNKETEILRYPKKYLTNNKQIETSAAYLLQTGEYIFSQMDKENNFVIHKGHEQDISLLGQYLYLKKTGLALGMPALKEWLPAHDVALSVDLSPEIEAVEMDKEHALKFLKKETPEIDIKNKGWYLVKYEGLGLGWVKYVGNRINNYLPKNWRIRMEITDADWK